MPRIPDEFLNCTVYLYKTKNDAIAGDRRGGTGFIPTPEATMQEGDYLIVMVAKDATVLLDELLEEPGEH